MNYIANKDKITLVYISTSAVWQARKIKVQGVRKFGHILICLLPGVHFNMNAQNSNNNKKKLL